MLEAEMRVICIDNENLEHVLTKYEVYVVASTSHRGAVVQVKGLPLALAASRFKPAKGTPSMMSELPRVSNQ